MMSETLKWDSKTVLRRRDAHRTRTVNGGASRRKMPSDTPCSIVSALAPSVAVRDEKRTLPLNLKKTVEISLFSLAFPHPVLLLQIYLSSCSSFLILLFF